MSDAVASVPVSTPAPTPDFRERHLARLLLSLYYAGAPISSLFEGNTRQIDSPLRIQRFDFWMREPGHLALALLHLLDSAPQILLEQRDDVKAALQRMLDNAALDTHRVAMQGSLYTTYSDKDDHLAFLTSTALVTDRPSFIRQQGSTHQIVLETSGIALAEKILAEAPSFGWYKAQAELIVRCFTALETIDLNLMPYLAPDLTPALAAILPLTPLVLARFARVFGETV